MLDQRDRSLQRLLREESGQAVTEYAVLFAWSVVLFLIAFAALRVSIFDFYQDVASLICLPIP